MITHRPPQSKHGVCKVCHILLLREVVRLEKLLLPHAVLDQGLLESIGKKKKCIILNALHYFTQIFVLATQ
jgi:hypothetical protein